jgi:1-acyl-sn-glycerol-3-phosphate acyltransferase
MVSLIRSILFYLFLIVMSIVASVVLVITAPFAPRNFRFSFVRFCNLAVINALRWLCGVRFQITGEEHINPQQAMVIASNHQGDWETFYLLTLGVPVSTVLKKELLHIPFFGWALAMLNPIAIDRKQKTNALKQLALQGCERLSHGISVLIFPEGTRHKPGRLGPCNKGAAMLANKAGVPILPIVQNSGHLSPAKSWVKRAGVVSVRIGEPIVADTSQELHAQMVTWLETNLAEIEY